MFSIFFINRPIFAKVISIFIMIVGLISLYLLPIAQFPEITPPSIQVSANYTGGSAQVVETSVTKPLEEQLNGIEGLIYYDSTSSSDGSSNINLYFKSGYDLNTAAIDVQNRVALANPFLPDSVKQLGVTTKKKSTSMLEILALKSTNPKHDALFLSNFANINILEELKRVPGVGDVMIFGEKKYSMRIWINPDKLSNLNLTVSQVTQAIKEQNLQAALGSVGSSPNQANNRFEYTLVSKSRLDNVKEFEDIIIKENTDTSRVLLKDVARVELGAENYKWGSALNNKDTAFLGIYQLPGANALDVAKLIDEKLQSLQSRFPEGISVEIPYDTTKFVKVSVKEVVITLFQALALVLFVVYFFLQAFRTTIIPAIAIPVSLIGTFALLLAMNFSINTLTLFGLILAIGIVVDDAIIVVENVETNMAKDPSLTPKEATTIAMKEVFAPVVSTTLVLLAVFVPVTFIPGISGALYQQFATTISFAVIISSINALTLSPALCATILKNNQGKEQKRNIIFEKFDNALDSFKNVYGKILEKMIKFWYIAILVYFLLLGATYFVFKVLPTGFIPDEDQGNLVVSISLDPGTTLNITDKTTRKIANIIGDIEGIKDTMSIPGYNLITGAIDSSSAAIFLGLTDWEKRTTVQTSIQGIINQIKAQTGAKISNASVQAFNMPSIPGLSAVGGFEFKLKNLQGMDIGDFEQRAKEFIQALNQKPEIMVAYTTFNSNYPQYFVDINRNKVASLGLKLNDVYEVLQANLGSLYINDFNKFGKTYKVYLQADQKYRENKINITNFFVQNSEGENIPLSAIAKIKRITGPNTITHYNGYQSIAVNGVHNISQGYSSGDALNAIEEVAKTLPNSIDFEFSGMSLQEKEAGNAAMYIFALSLLMVFLFLAAQYESWMMPLMIMLPIPAVMVGALGANMFAGLLNDTYTQIGLVLLIGMSSKSAILIVEFAKELREKGETIVNAAIKASVMRLRAILMTIFSFLLGILPLVVATGAGAASRQSLGTAVFGGMLMSTVLTLFLTPVLFVVLQRLREGKKSKEETNNA